MRTKKSKVEGRGRLVPARAATVGYEVRFGIPVMTEIPKGKKPASPKWVKCSIELDHGSLPEGGYFLYTTEGRVHQLKHVENEWQYLAVAA